MSLKNTIRNVLNIRKDRALIPAGPKPQIGSSIVRERLRIRLKYHITAEQWEWFTEHGWRTVDMRNNRREYTSVPDKILVKLLERQGAERNELHARLIKKTSAPKTSGEADKPELTPPEAKKPATERRAGKIAAEVD